MISPEQRVELVAKLAAAYAKCGSTTSVLAADCAPRVWYLAPDFAVRDAALVGFWRDDAVFVVGNRPYTIDAQKLFAAQEDALLASVEQQKREIDRLTSEHLATIAAAHEFIKSAKKERERPAAPTSGRK